MLAHPVRPRYILFYGCLLLGMMICAPHHEKGPQLHCSPYLNFIL